MNDRKIESRWGRQLLFAVRFDHFPVAHFPVAHLAVPKRLAILRSKGHNRLSRFALGK